MAIDKETKIETYNITLSDNDKLIKEARNYAIQDSIENSLQFNEDTLKQPLSANEIYFEEGIMYVNVANEHLDIWLEFELSDKIIIDILSSSMKRLNKLKMVLETLK